MIFKCRNCGGNSVYHPDKKTMWCPHCDSEESQQKVENDSITTCGNCGAPLDGVTEYTSALKCSHCGSYIILKERVEGENKPDLILPFAVSKDKAVEILNKEFGTKILIPFSFLSQASLECMEGSYVPFWLYDYYADIDYEAKATKVRVYVRDDIEYTETSHYRVTRKMDINFHKIPVDASKRMADDIMDLMEPYEYQALKQFEEKYMSGFEGEVVNFPNTDLEQRAAQRAKEASETMLNQTVTGYTTVVPVKKQIDISKKKAHFALLPVWVYRYEFRGKEYIYHVNGQTGKVIGTVPTDKRKAYLYTGTVFAITALICQCLNMILEVL